jgi:HEPN domain-containing protein
VTFDEMARDYLRRAQARRKALDTLFTAAAYPDVVRESQDIELVLKGALRFVGVDPPKRHDAHKVLARFVDRFPQEWRVTLDELHASLDRLAEERGPAFYGDDERGVPASDLFDEADARRAMSVADRLLDLYRRLLGEKGESAR